MTTFQIPTPDELASRLSGIEGLLTARKWERAAIVYAYTQPSHAGGVQVAPPPPKLNIRRFAAQGYAGLTSLQSVYHYRRAWETAIERGHAVRVEPGDVVPLPEMAFPEYPVSPSRRRTRITPEPGPGVLTDLSAADDALVRAIRRLSRSGQLRPDLREMALSSLEDVDDRLRQLREMVDPQRAQVTRLRPV